MIKVNSNPDLIAPDAAIIHLPASNTIDFCAIMIGFFSHKHTMYLEYAKLRIYPAAIVMTSMFSSVFSPVYATEKPHKQEFVVTAYYSPLPDQCCYLRGNYDAELALNGMGTNGADGTPVYAGMLAAPKTYPFGTVISLPGLGIGTVHDRGSAITEWGNDLHRIDIWVGSGEAGLARALTWGVRHVTGTVYPVGYEVMPVESVVLDNFPADTKVLATLQKTDAVTLLTQATIGERKYSVRELQTTLKTLGYFTANATGTFGPVTKSALQEFLSDHNLPGDGSNVDEKTAATLTAALSIGPKNLPDVPTGLHRGSKATDVRQVQKLLRYLGFYEGRTDGIFDEDLKKSVADFQLKNGVIAKAEDPNAGRLGPITQAAILKAWKAKVVNVKSRSIVAKLHAAEAVKGSIPSRVLSSGDSGSDVRLLQTFLRDAGYLTSADITGTFASRTKKALLKYQLDRQIVASETSHGAGVFGPTTKLTVAKEATEAKWQKVRAGG